MCNIIRDATFYWYKKEIGLNIINVKELTNMTEIGYQWSNNDVAVSKDRHTVLQLPIVSNERAEMGVNKVDMMIKHSHSRYLFLLDVNIVTNSWD